MASVLRNVLASAACRQLGIAGADLPGIINALGARTTPPPGAADGASLEVRIRRAAQGKRNADDGVHHLRVALGALGEVIRLIASAARLIEQAQKPGLGDSDRGELNGEFHALLRSVDEIIRSTKLHGTCLFGSTLSVAADVFGTLSIQIDAISPGADILAAHASLTSVPEAGAAAASLAAASDALGFTKTSLETSAAHLTDKSNALGILVATFSAITARIQDTVVVDEVVNLIKWQVLNLSGSNVLNEANHVSQQMRQIQELLRE